MIMRNYWWPGITKNVGKYVDKYNFGYIIKNRIEVPAENLMVNTNIKTAFQYNLVCENWSTGCRDTS